jgi:hypothetical protein
MARYSAFLGRKVEVQYRAGDILLPASGIFAADSGRSIFLEQNFEQKGQHKHFRWEIPYQCLVRIEEMPDSGATSNSSTKSAAPAPAKESPAPKSSEEHKSVASVAAPTVVSATSAAAAGAGGAATLLPLSHRPKTA